MRVAEVRGKQEKIPGLRLELDPLPRKVGFATRVVVIQVNETRHLPETLVPTEDGVCVQPELLTLTVSQQFVTRIVCDVDV